MASGTGNLPNQGMVAVPFDIITSQWGNDIIENIESIASGPGIGDNAITTAKVAAAAITASKIDFTTMDVWPIIGQVTAASNTTSISVSFSAKKYIKVVAYAVHNGSSGTDVITFNNRTGATDYSRSLSYADTGVMKYLSTDGPGIGLFLNNNQECHITYSGTGKSLAGANNFGIVTMAANSDVRSGLIGTKQTADITSCALGSSISGGIKAGSTLIVYGRD